MFVNSDIDISEFETVYVMFHADWRSDSQWIQWRIQDDGEANVHAVCQWWPYTAALSLTLSTASCVLQTVYVCGWVLFMQVSYHRTLS